MTARSCPTPEKRAFSSAKAAKASIVPRGRASHGLKNRVRAYQCPCGLWHLSKQEIFR